MSPPTHAARVRNWSSSQTRSAAAPGPIRPRSGQADQVGGYAAGRRDRVGQPGARRHHVGHREVHPQHGPGQRAVNAHRGHAVAFGQRDRLAAEQVASRRHPGARGGVGDQEDPAGRRGERDEANLGRDMLQVGDEAAGQPGVSQRLARHAGLAVMHRPLGVEQVGDHAGAGVRGGGDLRRRRVAVTHAGQDPGLGETGDRRQRPVPFRGQRQQPEQAGSGREQLPDRGRVGIGDPCCVVRALAAGRDERSLHVHAEHPGAAGQAGQQAGGCAQRRGQRVDRRGDDRGQERGRRGLG